MMTIKLFPIVGSFAENKDLARDIRVNKIQKAIDESKNITLDFEGVNSVTQSFIHALISELIRKYGIEILDRIFFKKCNENIKKIITIVTEYLQEGI